MQGQKPRGHRWRNGRAQASPVVVFQAPGYVADLAEILQAITTLYDEELRPFGRILRKRVGELAGAGRAWLPEIDTQQLRDVCETSDLVCIEQEDGGDWFVLLSGIEVTFVDVCSTHDPYSPLLWECMSSYLEQLDDDQMFLPGARYSCALVLMDRKLPFLLGHSLGQVCHIVQLSISQKKLLGYLNDVDGSLVPYARSQSMLKEKCAMRQRPCASVKTVASKGMPLASLEVARAGLRDMLEAVPGPKPAEMPLSNVKRFFRLRLGIALSETALGYPKLCDMLQGPFFADICSVRLDWNGYTVLQTGVCAPLVACNEGGFSSAAEPPRCGEVIVAAFCPKQVSCPSNTEAVACKAEVDVGQAQTEDEQPPISGLILRASSLSLANAPPPPALDAYICS